MPRLNPFAGMKAIRTAFFGDSKPLAEKMIFLKEINEFEGSSKNFMVFLPT